VDHVLAFTPQHHHVGHIDVFLMKLFPTILIYDLDIIRAAHKILDGEMTMGPHADVFLYSADLGLGFIYCNSSIRPLGHPIGGQCRNCGRLRPFDVNTNIHGQHATVRCKGCGEIKVMQTPQRRHIDRTVKQTGSGWVVDIYWGIFPQHLRK
jgi:hypothetical protein